MKKYLVTIMKFGYISVEANSEEEAEEKVYNDNERITPDAEGDWEIVFGETKIEEHLQ